MDRRLFEAIRKFVAQNSSLEFDRVLPGVTLREGLGIDGDDAHDFMENYSKQFGVNLEGFDFFDYFDAEAGALYYLAVSPEALRDKRSITLEDLTKAAEAGRWN